MRIRHYHRLTNDSLPPSTVSAHPCCRATLSPPSICTESVFSCPLQPTHSGCVYTTEDWMVFYSLPARRFLLRLEQSREHRSCGVNTFLLFFFFLSSCVTSVVKKKKEENPACYSYTLGPGNPSRDEIAVQPGWAAAAAHSHTHSHTNSHTHTRAAFWWSKVSAAAVCRPLTHIHCDFMPERNINMKMIPRKTKQLGVAALKRDLHFSTCVVC